MIYFSTKFIDHEQGINNSPESEFQNKPDMASEIKENSTNAHNLKVLASSCEVNEILTNISPRWKMQILYSISKGVYQFGKLKEAFPSLSDQVLGKRLGELTDENLVSKTILTDKTPTQIVYQVTEKGKDLLAVILDLHLWGRKYWEIENTNVCTLNNSQ
jgi:DNA-binding HxlR family transcriptional regulator